MDHRQMVRRALAKFGDWMLAGALLLLIALTGVLLFCAHTGAH